MHKLYKPCPKDAVCQISQYLDCQFMRRRFLKIHQILPPFAPYWATNLNPHSPKILPTKFGINQFSGFGEEIVKWKVYGRTTNDGRWLIPIAHFSIWKTVFVYLYIVQCITRLQIIAIQVYSVWDQTRQEVTFWFSTTISTCLSL